MLQVQRVQRYRLYSLSSRFKYDPDLFIDFCVGGFPRELQLPRELQDPYVFTFLA
jgi:hypothetical protein